MKGFSLGGKKDTMALDLLLTMVNFIPLKARVRFFETMGQFLYQLDGRHRRIARRNLDLAFGPKQPDEISKIICLVFRHLGRVLAEFTYAPQLNAQNIHRYVLLEGEENFRRAHQKGKGVLFLTAHFGNWEWMALAFPLLFGLPCHIIVRPLDSPFLNGFVERLRTATGNKIVPKEKSAGRILRLLKEGGTVGVLLDQNVAWQEGVFVRFFGELACTNIGLALLALKSGAPVIPAFNIRQADGRYRIILGPEVSLIRTGDKDLDVAKNTEFFTQIIERYAREYPDHWFWLHQRWKTRPWQAKRLRTV